MADEDPRAARLSAAVAKILARRELDGATVGLDIRSLSRDARVLARNADAAFEPASNLKLVTLYLSLAVLGPAYQFETALVGSGELADGGKLEGDLWVRGRGDPTLQPCFFESDDEYAPLQPFVQAMTLQGVRNVRGDLVVDDREFDRQFIPEGWPQNQLGDDYAAPVAALSLNGNCLHVRVTARNGVPPAAELRPAVSGWRLMNDLGPGSGPNQFVVSILPPDPDGNVRVRGSVGSEVGVGTAKLPVADPPLFFGGALKAALEHAGITIAGVVRRPEGNESPYEKARVLFTKRSPLLPALQLCCKESDNTIAEHLLKACAAARFGRGTYESGARLVQDLVRDLGVDGSRIKTFDGSGLSHLDQVTPAFLAKLLAQAYVAPWRDEFVRCLPISGVDGTLSKRMTEPAMQYRVRAKTGFINSVSALSGFAMSGDEPDREVFAFSIVINGFKGANAEMKKVQDDICRAIVALPRAGRD